MKHIELKQLVAVNESAFDEDPLRIYRLARLFARFGGEFTIPAHTLWQVRNACKNLSALPKERKFAELEKCFGDFMKGNTPSLMVSFLSDLGEFPEIAELEDVPQPPEHHPEGDAFKHTMLVLDAAHAIAYHPRQVYAALLHDLGKVPAYKNYGVLHGHEEMGVPLAEAFSDRFGVPGSWKKLAMTVARNHGRVHKILEAKPRKVYDLLAELKVEQSLDTLDDLLAACRADAWGRGPTRYGKDYPQGEFLWKVAMHLRRKKPKMKEESQEIALKWKDDHAMLASQIRAMKIAHVRVAMERFKNDC
jgi:tRNA nucleotidyltransferase (CCA-adding enzyme)